MNTKSLEKPQKRRENNEKKIQFSLSEKRKGGKL